MIDITLLQVLKHRKNYDRFRSVVNHSAIDQKTSVLLKDFGKYLEGDPDCEVVPTDGAFVSWFNLQHHTLKDETKTLYKGLLEQVSAEAGEAAEAMLIPRLVELDLAYQVGCATQRYNDGEEFDFTEFVRKLSEDAATHSKGRINIPFVDIGGSLFDDEVNDRGFSWRWDCLNENMRKLRGGDFIIFAARPDSGKTSAIADNATWWAKQLEEVYPEGGKTILWLNNEGPGKRIQQRILQNALDKGTSELVEMAKAGTLWDAYEYATGGKFRIRVLDIHGWRTWQVEELLRRVPPGLVIFDMIDNIRFDGALSNGGSRTDQVLESMYQWARDLAVLHDCPIIATSQTSGDAEGMAYPLMGMLKDSKTGKQGACDAIITMGESLSDGMASVRFIGQTKNKLQLEGKPKSCRAELILKSATGRFIER